MFQYLKAAFLVGIDVPLLGRLPLNALVFAGLMILGFGHPGFWLLGIGLETAWLASLASSRRFQKVVDSTDLAFSDDQAAARQQALVKQLPQAAQRRLYDVKARCDRAIELYRSLQSEDYIVEGNRDALARLQWLYTKLLVARQYLTSEQSQATEAQIRQQIADLQKDLRAEKIAPSIKESKTATLRILEKRLENLQRREQSVAEIDSDLTRIEAQVDLAVENATLRGQPQAVSSNIDLASHLLDPGVFGDSGAAIADLDQAFSMGTARQATSA